MDIPHMLRERFDAATQTLLDKLKGENSTVTDPFFAPRAIIYPSSSEYGEGIAIAATGHFLTRAAMVGDSHPATIEGFLDAYGGNNVAIVRAWLKYCQDLPRETPRPPHLWKYLLNEWPEEQLCKILEDGITRINYAERVLSSERRT